MDAGIFAKLEGKLRSCSIHKSKSLHNSYTHGVIGTGHVAVPHDVPTHDQHVFNLHSKLSISSRNREFSL